MTEIRYEKKRAAWTIAICFGLVIIQVLAIIIIGNEYFYNISNRPYSIVSQVVFISSIIFFWAKFFIPAKFALRSRFIPINIDQNDVVIVGNKLNLKTLRVVKRSDFLRNQARFSDGEMEVSISTLFLEDNWEIILEGLGVEICHNEV